MHLQRHQQSLLHLRCCHGPLLHLLNLLSHHGSQHHCQLLRLLNLRHHGRDCGICLRTMHLRHHGGHRLCHHSQHRCQLNLRHHGQHLRHLLRHHGQHLHHLLLTLGLWMKNSDPTSSVRCQCVLSAYQPSKHCVLWCNSILALIGLGMVQLCKCQSKAPRLCKERAEPQGKA